MSEPELLPEHAARNRAYWDEVNAPIYAEPGRRSWARTEITWGIFGVPEADLHALPAELAGRDVIELGCGTAYFGAWLARRGANVTGIDNSAKQLETARALQDEHLGYGDWIRLLRANGFEVVDLIEVRAPDGAMTAPADLVDPEWARQWPAEQIWRARKR